MSPSLRGRGLKCLLRCSCVYNHLSPSLRGRGLKFFNFSCSSCYFSVALFTRAWIEIASLLSACQALPVALFTRAWIEIAHTLLYHKSEWVALFTRAWIEMGSSRIICSREYCRPLCEGVDWNVNSEDSGTAQIVALFTRAWIEIFCHVRCDCHRNFIQKQGLKLLIFCFTIRNSYY